MKKMFNMGDYKFNEGALEIERALSRVNCDFIVSQQEQYNILARQINDCNLNLATSFDFGNLNSILEPLMGYREMLKRNNMEIIGCLSDAQNRICEQMSRIWDSIQETLLLTSSSLTDFSTIIESINGERILEQWIDKIGNGEENTEVSSEEITEAYDDLTDILNDARNWQQILTDVIRKWREKNLVICFLLVNIVLPLILSVLATPIYNGITSNNASIKDEPSASGNTICNITVNQHITIISTSTNYYYEVEFYDEESGELIKGWLSKRSVKLNEETSESETEETEEVSE